MEIFSKKNWWNFMAICNWSYGSTKYSSRTNRLWRIKKYLKSQLKLKAQKNIYKQNKKRFYIKLKSHKQFVLSQIFKKVLFDSERIQSPSRYTDTRIKQSFFKKLQKSFKKFFFIHHTLENNFKQSFLKKLRKFVSKQYDGGGVWLIIFKNKTKIKTTIDLVREKKVFSQIYFKV